MLIDTHCHIHSEGYGLSPEDVLKEAQESNIKLVCVGTSAADSKRAVEFSRGNEDCYVAVGLHPHDASLSKTELGELVEIIGEDPVSQKIVAIGECGLDYYYNHSPREAQVFAFEEQLQLAKNFDLPLIFHVRDAFEDFWPVLDNFPGIRGVVHSFSSTKENLAEPLKRNLFIGLNGIMTFSKNEDQLEAARVVPLDRLVLETDSPFLTPTPYRGKINKPTYVRVVGEFLARLRGEPFELLAEKTTRNAAKLFGI